MEMRKTLTPDDWAAAALSALAEGGVGSVAVEPLATRLGTTKGSFYWHFRSRDELLAAALRLWERRDTEDVIATVGAGSDPVARLRALLMLALGSAERRTSAAAALALQAHADHPLVAPALERVTRRRLAYLAELFEALGFAADEARSRALVAYTAYLGHAQLRHATPNLAPRDDELRAYADTVVDALARRA